MPVAYAEVDCPECKGAGTARVDIDQASNTRLGLHCRDCDFEVNYGRPDTPSSDDVDLNPDNPARPENAAHPSRAGSAAAARRNAEKATRKSTLEAQLKRQETANLTDRDFPHHVGAGWYLLTNGSKERGKQAAIEAQLLLTPNLDHLQQYKTSEAE